MVALGNDSSLDGALCCCVNYRYALQPAPVRQEGMTLSDISAAYSSTDMRVRPARRAGHDAERCQRGVQHLQDERQAAGEAGHLQAQASQGHVKHSSCDCWGQGIGTGML
jgi:hypothetical protein